MEMKHKKIFKRINKIELSNTAKNIFKYNYDLFLFTKKYDRRRIFKFKDELANKNNKMIY